MIYSYYLMRWLVCISIFRLVKSVLGKSEEVYKDYETSDAPMKLLENRIQAFHIKYGEGHKTKNLPNLRRYKLDVSNFSTTVFGVFFYLCCCRC